MNQLEIYHYYFWFVSSSDKVFFIYNVIVYFKFGTSLNKKSILYEEMDIGMISVHYIHFLVLKWFRIIMFGKPDIRIDYLYTSTVRVKEQLLTQENYKMVIGWKYSVL